MTMFKKENVAPVKQGVFYELNLSKNNGPYLSKDIMYSNPRSNNLLTNHAILNEHKKMVETLTQLDKNAKMQHTKDESTQNFAAVAKSCETELASCQQMSAALEVEQSRFRRDIESLYEKVSGMNNSLLQHSMPVLKNLMKRVKETNQADKAEYYKIQKELQSLELQKRSLEHILFSCRLRIQSMERCFGVKPESPPQSFVTSTSLQ